MSFADILEDTRVECARAAFKRARVASKLRKASARKSARTILSKIKTAAAKNSLALAPEHASVVIDKRYHVGLPLVRWNGRRGIHVPSIL